MKCIIILVLACALASQAQPFFGLGEGYGGGLGGLLGMNRNYASGRGYGNQMYNRGLGGQTNQGYLNSGQGQYHNIGGHNRRMLNLQQAEDSGYHNIGGGHGFNNGGYGSNGYNGYENGAGGYGNGYGMGSENMMM